jgi:hypothetical protein
VTWADYKRMTLAEMYRRRWRVVLEVQTHHAVIQPGLEVRVVGKKGGLKVVGPECPHCRVSVVVRKVPPDRLEEIRE